ncbi:MAG: putative peptidoglycan glycosyltransferase FtsW [Phycisphaerae bacterium]|nr:putative peptidoglycan glycosyltransferase FtsW [Phycisphaerae bacterium]
MNLTRLAWGVALPVAFLLVLGMVTIHATERDESLGVVRPNPAAELRSLADRAVEWVGPQTLRQAFYVLTGVVLMLAAMTPNYQRYGRVAYQLYWACLLLLALLVADRFLQHYGVDIPFVPVRRNTRRWIQIVSFQVQPSEFVKPAIVLALARYLRYRRNYREWPGLLMPALMTLAPMALIHFQPDLGTLLMLLPLLFAMLFVAGARVRHLATVVVLGAVALPAFYFLGMAEYQKKRIDVVFRQNDPDESWQMNEGYQLRQSKIALGLGGATGEGFARGVFIEHDLLPEEHNDFIFAIIGHQLGFVGCVLVILAYGLIVFMGIEIATATNDPFGRLLVIGVVVMIVMQALLNIGMTLGLTPITGMTLPFVSAGGSSLWANFFALGLLLNVANRRPMLIANPPFEQAPDGSLR